MKAKYFLYLLTIVTQLSCSGENNKRTIDDYNDLLSTNLLLKNSNNTLETKIQERLLAYEYLYDNEEFQQYFSDFKNLINGFNDFSNSTQEKTITLRLRMAYSENDLKQIIASIDHEFFETWVESIQVFKEFIENNDLDLLMNIDDYHLLQSDDKSLSIYDKSELLYKFMSFSNIALGMENLFLAMNLTETPILKSESKFIIVTSPKFKLDF